MNSTYKELERRIDSLKDFTGSFNDWYTKVYNLRMEVYECHAGYDIEDTEMLELLTKLNSNSYRVPNKYQASHYDRAMNDDIYD
ncbi:MAG: hypothetical protein EOP56_09200 [Sphingobacteriales bacterium]|nr:MAG: hypothetical protein EOP56_09200 [Sphingobacteriales bacterium]